MPAHVNPIGGGPAEPSPNGGNGVTRGTTRRRHAANQLLMLQNPHRSQPRAPRRLQNLGSGPIGAKKLAQHSSFRDCSAKNFAQHVIKRRLWAIFRAQGELFRAHAHDQTEQGELSRTERTNVATLKPMTPLRPLLQTNVKPPSPMLAPKQRPLKPPSPLQPKNTPKTPISHPQRRCRFQLGLSLREQRRRRFQAHARTSEQRRRRFHARDL